MKELLASLRWSEVFARGGSSRFASTGLLNAEGAALKSLSLESFSCSISLI